MKYPSWYTTPLCQVILVGFTCFATVGMFSAVSNLGAGGLQNVSLSDTANGVLYGFFAVTGLFAGGICNVLGPPLTLCIGTLGYTIYLGALWCHQTQGTDWFLIFAGALLGISAALLWAAQGCIMMSYPLEKDKGKSFSIFWAIFQFGAFFGSVIALAINLRDGKLQAVSTKTYIAFLIVTLIGIASSALILGPNHIVRGDGTRVKLQATATVREELVGFTKLLRDWRMLALLPMFFASNYFYAYQGAINAAMFDGPTRAVNGSLSAGGAISGALFIGFCILDVKWFGRRNRGYFGLAIVTCLVITVWMCGLAWQLTFTRATAGPPNLINYKEARFARYGTLFFFYYFTDACYQALAYWVMAALTNDPFKLARYAGLYKAVQSAGGAGSFGMDAVMTPYINEWAASCALQIISLPLIGIVVHSIKETNYNDEKMVYVDDVTEDSVEKGDNGEKGSTEKGDDVKE